jgi:DNA-binding response OmpR family regulator
MASAPDIADFIVAPPPVGELTARLFRIAATPELTDVRSHDDLVLNTATYQAALAGRPLDLTFMEYELLRYFIEHPGRVWSREQLLSAVWGYDYFGGARTVDVHVRRLRAKLGEQRSSWISTVRSVGYRFG